MKSLLIPLFALILNQSITSVCSAGFAAGQILIGFDEPPSSTEVSELIESFGLSILEDHSNLAFTPFYLISVPCEQEINWVNIFSNMKNIKYAELNSLGLAGISPVILNGPKYLYRCKVFPSEVTYDETTLLLNIPSVVANDGSRYNVVLEPPFNFIEIKEKEVCEFNDKGQLISCLTNE